MAAAATPPPGYLRSAAVLDAVPGATYRQLDYAAHNAPIDSAFLTATGEIVTEGGTGTSRVYPEYAAVAFAALHAVGKVVGGLYRLDTDTTAAISEAARCGDATVTIRRGPVTVTVDLDTVQDEIREANQDAKIRTGAT